MKYILFLGEFGDQLGGWQHFEEGSEAIAFLKAVAERSTVDWAHIASVEEKAIVLYGIRKLDVKASFDEGFNHWRWEWTETAPKLWETILGKKYETSREI